MSFAGTLPPAIPAFVLTESFPSSDFPSFKTPQNPHFFKTHPGLVLPFLYEFSRGAFSIIGCPSLFPLYNAFPYNGFLARTLTLWQGRILFWLPVFFCLCLQHFDFFPVDIFSVISPRSYPDAEAGLFRSLLFLFHFRATFSWFWG